MQNLTLAVPFHYPSIGDAEVREVEEVLRSGWLTSGPKTAQFEKEFCEFTGAPHALAVNSGTAALHLALAALGVGPGDEVITTPLTFCATVNVILHTGATPILADIGPDGNIDAREMRRAITSRTKALLPVHFAGLPCDMAAIGRLAERFNLRVVEDAAHATGASYAGTPIGGWKTDAAAFSFYATKNLTTGEGGMVTTHDASLWNRMKVLCLHGISADAWNRYSERGRWYYDVLDAGFKYNLSDILAAIGIHQLRRQADFLARRTEIARRYTESFSQLEELECPPETAGRGHAWHLYVLRLRLDRLTVDRAEFIRRLTQAGIGTSVHFVPIPMHPAYSGMFPASCWLKAREFYRRCLSLPLYPAMSNGQVELVIEAVQRTVRVSRSAQAVAATHA